MRSKLKTVNKLLFKMLNQVLPQEEVNERHLVLTANEIDQKSS